MPYSPVTVTGYNANPPEDDGTHVTTNEISWAGIKEKLGDPLKTAIDGIQTAIDTIVDTLEITLSAPVGTIMLFRQTAAPTGWTKITTHNDHALRVVSGTVSTGGSTVFSTIFAARTIAQVNIPSYNLNTSTLTAAAGGAHSHDFPSRRFAPATGANDLNRISLGQADGASATSTGIITDSATHTHTLTGTLPSGGSGTAMDFAVKYCDVIEASKD